MEITQVTEPPPILNLSTSVSNDNHGSTASSSSWPPRTKSPNLMDAHPTGRVTTEEAPVSGPPPIVVATAAEPLPLPASAPHSSEPNASNTTTPNSFNNGVIPATSIPPGSPLKVLPPHVLNLLIKCNISSVPSRLSPFKCVLTRHPIHRDFVESHLTAMVAKIRSNGFDETLSASSPLIAVRYSKPTAVPTRAVGSVRHMVHSSWGEHPIIYVIGGAVRGEAVAHLVQNQPEHPHAIAQRKGLEFYLIDGNQTTPWDIFLLSTALNAADRNSRPSNYFERTDQIAFIARELAQRKQADATCREIAAEICFNPFLEELRAPLRLLPESIPLYSLSDPNLQPPIRIQLMRSRELFPSLPANMGILLTQIPNQCLEVLDVLIDMATCVNSERMKCCLQPSLVPSSKTSGPTGTSQQPNTEHAGALGVPIDNANKETNGTSSRGVESSSKKQIAKTEGFLHAVAEDQLRHIFRDIVPLSSGSSFDVLALRDMVSIVFGAIQECSRQFRQSVSNKKSTENSITDSAEQSNNGTVNDNGDNFCDSSAATSKAAAAYWIERIVYEASPGGLLVGMWNFPAAALVALFYVYFVNELRSFDKPSIQENILRIGTVLYRCVAELALTLRASKISLMTAATATEVRVLEGVAILFRFALFGTVDIELFPRHPFVIPIDALRIGSPSKPAAIYTVKTFTDIDVLYQFLYSYWFKGLITASRQQPQLPLTDIAGGSGVMRNHGTTSNTGVTIFGREGTTAAAPNITSAPQVQQQNKAATAIPVVRRPWPESRRLDVTATANRLRQEVEAMVASGNAGDRIRLKRLGKRVTPGSSEVRSPADLVDVEVIDPSILPMATAARLEFITLVHGVVSMLIERHQHSDPQNPNSPLVAQSASVQILTVPANMVVLAAIKVALSFISPHFDKLAPLLTHWTTTRTRLVLWIWRTSKEELTKRAEERWVDLWKKQMPRGTPPPKLKVCFVTGQRPDRSGPIELTAAKLGEVIAAVLPDVLESMSNYYDEKNDASDEHVTREFFARWLKSASDSDLISRVNAILSRSTALAPAGRLGEQKSPSSPQSQDPLSKRSRHDRFAPRTAASDVLRPPPPTVYMTNDQSPLPTGVAASRPVMTDSVAPSTLAAQGSTTVSSTAIGKSVVMGRGSQLDIPAAGNKKTRRAATRMGTGGDDDYAEWLENLSYTERFRLDKQEVPRWELPCLSLIPAPDLIRWRPPEPTHPFYGNGLRGPAFDAREWRRLRQLEKLSLYSKSSVDPAVPSPEVSPILPLSDLDWKVTASVLRLLRSRGVDVLASRGRGQIFFLDQVLSYAESLRYRLGNSGGDSGSDEDRLEDDLDGDEQLHTEEKKNKKTTTAGKKYSAVDLAFQKRYGSQFFKGGELIEDSSKDRIFGRIPDVDCIRSFLEYDDMEDTT